LPGHSLLFDRGLSAKQKAVNEVVMAEEKTDEVNGVGEFGEMKDLEDVGYLTNGWTMVPNSLTFTLILP
jgi:hypothetical protein